MFKTSSWLLAWGWLVLSLMFTNNLNAQDTGNAGVTSSLYLAQAQGAVTVIHEGSAEAVQPPQYLFEQDQIVTGPDAKAYLQFQNGGIVEVGPSSNTTVSTLEISGDDFKAKFLLVFGKLKAKVKKLTTASSTFEIYAGGVVAGVREPFSESIMTPAKNKWMPRLLREASLPKWAGRKRSSIKGCPCWWESPAFPYWEH